jgi:sulfofructosephosphate aldolase
LSPSSPIPAAAFDRLARGNGTLAMLAIDQRESLRAMFTERAGGAPASDALLGDFKRAVAQELAGEVSAILLDHLYGRSAIADVRARENGCGVILAADTLVQDQGGPVTDTHLDPAVDAACVHAEGADALKLLVLWTGEPGNRERCLELVRELVQRSRDAGVAAIIEGVVRRPAGVAEDAWDREAALIEAAAAFSSTGLDLYKAEVPYFGRGDRARIEDACAQITAALPCPWVVLSSGVAAEDFPTAVATACRAGASGFLAGRAIWHDAAAPDGYRERLRAVAVPRARELAAIVDSTARPWREALPAAR